MSSYLDGVRGRLWRAYADGRRRVTRAGSAAGSAVACAGVDRSDVEGWTAALAERHQAYRDAVEPAGGDTVVVCVSSRPHLLESVVAAVARQTLAPHEFVLVANSSGYDDVDIEGTVARLDGSCATTVLRRPAHQSLGACLNDAMDAGSARFIAKFDDDDLYGPHHLADALRAHSYAGAGVVGKHTYYAHLVGSDTTVLRFPAHEFLYSSTLAGGSLVIDRARTGDLRFDDISLGEDRAFIAACHRRGVSTFSADRFNFVQTRAHDNTWQVPDDAFLRSTTEVGDGVRLDVTDI